MPRVKRKPPALPVVTCLACKIDVVATPESKAEHMDTPGLLRRLHVRFMIDQLVSRVTYWSCPGPLVTGQRPMPWDLPPRVRR